MIIPNTPSKEQALAELFPLTALLYEAFPEIAENIVLPYFFDRQREVDERLATDMFRYEMKHVLNSRGVDVDLDDEDMGQEFQSEVDLNWLPNNGIEGTYKGWRFKLLRSRNGSVPPPGRSERRKLYYAQQLPLAGFENPVKSQYRPNLVILWDFERPYKQVTINLAMPKESTGAFGAVQCHFNDVVRHPAEVTAQMVGTLKHNFEDCDLPELDVSWKESYAANSYGNREESQIPTIEA